jgi:chemotaxis response regulator CheB
MRALIIEDQALIANMIWAELTRIGYDQIEIVDSERDAILSAERECPDLITADDSLASGTGVDAVLRICSDRAIPVVFVVGNPWNVKFVLPEAIIVEKPFTLDALSSAVDTAKISARILTSQ